jgi:preprotein translocase subunit SecD
MWFGDRLGGGLVTGVAISLFIGVAASMFTAVVVSRNLLQLMAWIGLGQRISLFTPESASSPAQTTGGNR